MRRLPSIVLRALVGLVLALGASVWTPALAQRAPVHSVVAAPKAYEGFIATRAGILDFQSASSDQAMSRSAHVATDDITSIRLIYQNFRITSNSALEIGNGGSATVSATVEYPAGVFTDITFGGGSVGNMSAVDTAGAHTGENGTTVPAGSGTVTSDLVTLNRLIPRGETFWVRSLVTNTSGIYFWLAQDTAAGDRIKLQGATTWTLATLKDDASNGLFASVTLGAITPLAIIGPTDRESVLIPGDSIVWGQNDFTVATAAGPGRAPDRRYGLVAPLIPTGVAAVNIASGSMAASASSTSGADRAFQNVLVGRAAVFPYASIVIDELGVNDSITAANLMAAKLANMRWTSPVTGTRISPTAKIYFTTLTPYNVTTSDGYTSVAGQTVGSRNTEEQSFNTTLRAQGNGGAFGYFEIAWSLESSPGSGKWYVPANARGFTDANIALGSNQLNSTSQANFQGSDSGWAAYIVGTGNVGGTAPTGGFVQLPAATGVVSTTQVLIDKNANKAGTNVQAYVGAATPDGIHPVHGAYQKVVDDGVVPCSIFKSCWILAGFVPARRRKAANDNDTPARRAA